MTQQLPTVEESCHLARKFFQEEPAAVSIRYNTREMPKWEIEFRRGDNFHGTDLPRPHIV